MVTPIANSGNETTSTADFTARRSFKIISVIGNIAKANAQKTRCHRAGLEPSVRLRVADEAMAYEAESYVVATNIHAITMKAINGSGSSGNAAIICAIAVPFCPW